MRRVTLISDIHVSAVALEAVLADLARRSVDEIAGGRTHMHLARRCRQPARQFRSSLEIEQAVREAISDGRPLYAIDRDLLEQLKPDLILTQNLCAVCAVSAAAVNELCAAEVEVVALAAHTLRSFGPDVVGCGPRPAARAHRGRPVWVRPRAGGPGGLATAARLPCGRRRLERLLRAAGATPGRPA
jgi:hypothetical protein